MQREVYLECYMDNKRHAHKFYRMIQAGTTITTQWGAIGTSKPTGQEQNFATDAEAAEWYGAQLTQKLKKYVRAVEGEAPPKIENPRKGKAVEDKQENNPKTKAALALAAAAPAPALEDSKGAQRARGKKARQEEPAPEEEKPELKFARPVKKAKKSTVAAADAAAAEAAAAAAAEEEEEEEEEEEMTFYAEKDASFCNISLEGGVLRIEQGTVKEAEGTVADFNRAVKDLGKRGFLEVKNDDE